MIGETVGHYEILEKLGSGGMGEVWLAEDTRLERKVALKFLPPEAATEEEQTRFIREAQAASALDHLNICTIHEVNETDDNRTYIAMAFCDGETVKEKISRGPLGLEEALDIAIQIGEGLARAHKEGIVHRDIKPANAILTKDGTVKIVDFGLAKLSGSTQLTKTGTTMGTAAYMSPEQIRGEEVDHRTDIWALGVMLYEMVTGEPPFKGENETALTYAILNDEPENIIAIRDDIPHQTDIVIGRALVKNPANRYQDVQEMVEEIRNLPIGETGQHEWEKSIVVLPFENMSPDPEQEYFSDGLTEEIIADLSKIHSLRVISRTSAMMLKNTKKPLRIIGRELNVQYALEGSVRKAGNDLRITAQLIDAETDAHLWAEKYSGTLDDVFEIQEKVSRSIVDALELKLSSKEEIQVAERPIQDTQAYDLLLRAKQEINSFTEDGLERALLLINNGLRILGDNELLYEALGYTYFQYFNAGFKKEESILKKTEECADKVFDLNPNSYAGHYLRALIHWKRGNIQKAIRDYKCALELNPNHADSLMQISWFYTISGKSFAAKTWLNRSMDIAPLDWLNHFAAGWLAFVEGKFEIGLESLLQMYKLESRNPFCRLSYGHGLAYDHKFEEAYELLDLAMKESQGPRFLQFSVFLKYALQNKKSEALQSVTQELKRAMQTDEFTPLLMAECYALIDEKDEAINWLEEVVKWGFINYPFLNEHDPFLENIRGEERFKKLMERVKHEWENFEV